MQHTINSYIKRGYDISAAVLLNLLNKRDNLLCKEIIFCFFATRLINRRSYMSAHVLLNLLNELGKSDKMRGLPSILSLFRNEFNKFNNARA